MYFYKLTELSLFFIFIKKKNEKWQLAYHCLSIQKTKLKFLKSAKEIKIKERALFAIFIHSI